MSPDWESEFQLFIDYLPEEKKLKENYLHKPMKSGDRRKDIYTNKKKEDNVKIIELSYIKDSLYSVRINIHSKDKLSKQTTSLSYLSNKSIGIKGEIELFSSDIKEFEIFAEIEND